MWPALCCLCVMGCGVCVCAVCCVRRVYGRGASEVYFRATSLRILLWKDLVALGKVFATGLTGKVFTIGFTGKLTKVCPNGRASIPPKLGYIALQDTWGLFRKLGGCLKTCQCQPMQELQKVICHETTVGCNAPAPHRLGHYSTT